jgi:hypothetical protein
MQANDGMARPEELCEILQKLEVKCTSHELQIFLESIGSLHEDGRYSWFELVSFLQPHGDREIAQVQDFIGLSCVTTTLFFCLIMYFAQGHFESTLILLDWHMKSFRSEPGAETARSVSEGQTQENQPPNAWFISSPEPLKQQGNK